MNTLREKLKNEIVLLDGSFGTYAQSLGLSDADFKDHPGCMEYLSATRPDLISKIHNDYLGAGSDAVETNTFGGNAVKLAEYGLADKVYDVNLTSTRIARVAADSFSDVSSGKYVIGSIGPTGKLPSSTDPVLGDITYKELKKIFYDQALGLIDGGADALLVETGQDLLEMKAAVNGAKSAIAQHGRDLVLMAQCTLANNGRMLLGTEMSAVMTTLGYLGVDVIGINCSTGPVEMENTISVLSDNCPALVSIVPNAGLPVENDGETLYPLKPKEMAGIMKRYVKKYRINVIGGCCGTTPEHIREIKKVVRANRGQSTRSLRSLGTVPLGETNNVGAASGGEQFCSSFYRGIDLSRLKRPIKVGERINTQGSRKMKNLLLGEDYDGIVELGKAQESAGSEILDVCGVLTERSTERRDAVILTKRLGESVNVPLMIDSTDVDVIEAALQSYPGTAFINYANLEDGGEKARRIFKLAKEHASFVVNLVIDKKGMAKSVERKIEIARELYRIATVECAIEPHRLIFDMLTFTLGTGEAEYADAAIKTYDGIKRLKKEFPEVLTALGVSNISFGLAKEGRRSLNMVFLEHAVRAGLDMAIVNPSEFVEYDDIEEEEIKLSEDLIFNSASDALNNFVEYFENKVVLKDDEESLAAIEDVSIEEQVKMCVINRDKADIIPLIDKALRENISPEHIIDPIIMGTMAEIGEKLESGEMVLPYVLQSAEVVRKAIEHLETFLPKGAIKRGTVLLATVLGDVHDIGKNLVKMILENNGFSVIDLGKQVPIEKIVEEAKKNKVDAVGLSALLVSTSRYMKTCVQSMHDAGLDYPVLIGGSPTNDRFAKEISALRDKSIYKGGVFYAKDAFTGLKLMRLLTDPVTRKEAIADQRGQTLTLTTDEERKCQCQGLPPKRKEKRHGKAPMPPFFGIRPLSNVSADEVFSYLEEGLLFDGAWGGRLRDKKEKKRIAKEEFKPLLEELKEEVIRKGLLDLKAVYGYFKCHVSGDDMDVLSETGEVIEKINFTRLRDRCLADYFTDGSEGYDIVAFQAVTVGDKINDAIEELNKEKEYNRAFSLHGLSVYLAEAMASYVHNIIQKELGLKKGRGKRYSPGYPLWKNLEDQKKLFDLLEVEKRLGIKLTEAFQMVPEQSTTAMIVYNERAEY